jgi:hypothetical protein
VTDDERALRRELDQAEHRILVWLALDGMCVGRRILAWDGAARLTRDPVMRRKLHRYAAEACDELEQTVPRGREVLA